MQSESYLSASITRYPVEAGGAPWLSRELSGGKVEKGNTYTSFDIIVHVLFCAAIDHVLRLYLIFIEPSFNFCLFF